MEKTRQTPKLSLRLYQDHDLMAITKEKGGYSVKVNLLYDDVIVYLHMHERQTLEDFISDTSGFNLESFFDRSKEEVLDKMFNHMIKEIEEDDEFSVEDYNASKVEMSLDDQFYIEIQNDHVNNYLRKEHPDAYEEWFDHILNDVSTEDFVMHGDNSILNDIAHRCIRNINK